MNINNGIIISNLIWRLLERTGAQIVQFVVSVVLARIIAPEAYGTITLVLVFSQILQVFVDSGLGNALIQKKDADDLDFSSVFFFNVFCCIGLYGIIYFSAPLIAGFYDDLSLTAVIRVLCLTVVISGLKNVQQAYVSRTMQFKKFFFATIGGTVASAVIGIVMALNDLGVWALVAQKLSNLFIDTLVLWLTVKWRPKRMFSWSRLRRLISFGWKLLASALLDTVYNNLRNLIIGKMYSTSDLAFYSKGQQLPNLLAVNINISIDSVLLPVMSNAQDDRKRIKRMTRHSIKVSTYVMAPMMIGLAVCANSIIKLLLTDKWLLCVPYMRIFCITYMFYPIHTANLNAIKAMGRSDLFLKLEIAKKLVGISALVITIPFGVLPMAYSLLVTSVLAQIINSWPNRNLMDYGYLEQLKDILPNIGAAVIMGSIVLGVEYLKWNEHVTLVIQILVGGVIYFIFSAGLKLESYLYIKEAVGKNIQNRRK